MAEKNGIEVYIRPSGGRVLLNFHVPPELRHNFIDGLRSGSLDGAEVPIHFEIAPLPEWSTDPKDRARLAKLGPIHMRVTLAAINVNFEADGDA